MTCLGNTGKERGSISMMSTLTLGPGKIIDFMRRGGERPLMLRKRADCFVGEIR